MYKATKFELRAVEEIKRDIEAVRRIADGIKETSWKVGAGGKITREVASTGIQIFGKTSSLVNVLEWLLSGAKTAFLQDSNTLIMRTPELIEVIRCLKQTFPPIERITSYGRSKTAAKKTSEELKDLRKAGLTRLHIGLESGDDQILKEVDKGVTAEGHITGGRKVIAADIELSEYVMPGLGGQAKWIQHARNTAKVLNEINPHFVRMRPFVPRSGTPLFEDYQQGRFALTSPHQRNGRKSRNYWKIMF